MSNPYQKLQPLTDRVIIQPEKLPEKSAGGIVLPELRKDRPQQGRVVAVGPGRFAESGQRLPMSVVVGDTVIFNQYAASEMDVDGAKLFMLHEHEITCIIRQ